MPHGIKRIRLAGIERQIGYSANVPANNAAPPDYPFRNDGRGGTSSTDLERSFSIAYQTSECRCLPCYAKRPKR
jgi:hypothetical protein